MASTIKKRKAKKRKFGFIMILIGVALLFSLFDNQFRPLIKTIAQSKATAITNQIINDTVLKTLEDSDFSYDSLVSIERDENGTVTSVKSNMSNVNEFKARITSDVQDAINQYETQTVKIPIGTIIGGDLFVGRGPTINFKLNMSSSIVSTISNIFDGAGINQTRHQIMLNITTKVYIIIPWYNTATTVESNFLIAETIIVGLVPQSYTSVLGSEDIVGDINDYSAEDNLK